jgi:hypothetical protein
MQRDKPGSSAGLVHTHTHTHTHARTHTHTHTHIRKGDSLSLTAPLFSLVKGDLGRESKA